MIIQQQYATNELLILYVFHNYRYLLKLQFLNTRLSSLKDFLILPLLLHPDLESLHEVEDLVQGEPVAEDHRARVCVHLLVVTEAVDLVRVLWW